MGFCVSAQAGEHIDMKGEGVLRLLLQPWESREVSVVFTPSEHKPTTTILIIRYQLISEGWVCSYRRGLCGLKISYRQRIIDSFFFSISVSQI